MWDPTLHRCLTPLWVTNLRLASTRLQPFFVPPPASCSTAPPPTRCTMPSARTKCANVQVPARVQHTPLGNSKSKIGDAKDDSLPSTPSLSPVILPHPDEFDPLRRNPLAEEGHVLGQEWINFGNIAFSHFQPLNMQDINGFIALPPSNSMREPALELPTSPCDSPVQSSANALQYTERLVGALLPAGPMPPLPHMPPIDDAFNGLEPFTKEVLLECGLIDEEPPHFDDVRQWQKSLRSQKDDTAALLQRVADGAAAELCEQRARRARKIDDDELEIRYMRSQLERHRTNRKKYAKTQQVIYRNFHQYPHIRDEYRKSVKVERERKASKDGRVSMATQTRSATRKILALKREACTDDAARGVEGDNASVHERAEAPPPRSPSVLLKLPLRNAARSKSNPRKDDDPLAALWLNGTLRAPATTLRVAPGDDRAKRNPAPEADIGWWATWCGASGPDNSLR